VILISLATLIEHISGRNLRIDQFLMADPTTPLLVTAPGRMAIATSISLLLLGCALFGGNRPRGVLWSQLLALSVAVICLVNLVGYIFGFSNFADIAFYTAMPVHTSFGLLMLCVAILFSRPGIGVMTLVTSESLGGLLTRNVLPAAVVVPVLLQWVVSQGESHGLYGPVLSDALVATSYIVVFASLIWIAGRKLTGMEAEKGRATALAGC
jgi:hypothetical protein